MLQPGPLEALAPDADAVADRAVVRLHQIEEALLRLDHDRAGRLGGAEEHQLPAEFRGKLLLLRGRDVARTFFIAACGRRIAAPPDGKEDEDGGQSARGGPV